jgi:hypothetical protein
MGRAPVITPETIAGLRADAQMRKENGVPIIDDFPAWIDPEYTKAKKDANNAFKNVDDRLYADYFAMITDGKSLRVEEPILAQDLYAELTKCLQAVLTDRNANVQALLDTAQRNFQRILDSEINR